MNQTIELLKHHTSIRKFNQLPITAEEETAILECAMRGATAGNMMLYHMVTIRDKGLLQTLGNSCDKQPFIGTAQLAILFVVDNNKWCQFFKNRQVTDQGKAYDGPEIPDMLLGMQDAMIAAQNAVIAAESLGIGTCYIGDIIEQAEYHKELFELPNHTMPATLVVMGRYDQKPSIRSRFESRFMVSQNKYPQVDDTFLNGMFAEMEGSRDDFAQKFYSRKIEADFFKEMIRSAKLYLKQWL